MENKTVNIIIIMMCGIHPKKKVDARAAFLQKKTKQNKNPI